MFLRKIARLANLTRLPIARLQPTKFARIIRHNHFYTQSHEFIHFVKDDVVRIGLSKYAISNMGEIVYVGVENIGEQFDKNDEIVVIESVKAASEILAPEDGTIISHNNDIIGNYKEIMKKNEIDLWLLEFQISNTIDQDSLMTIDDYNNFIDNRLQLATNIKFS